MSEHPKVEVAGDELRLGFGAYGQEVEVAAISGDGARVLTVREVGVAQIRDARTREPIAELRPASPLVGSALFGGFEVYIEAAALDADGTTALLGLNDGTAALYRVADGVEVARLAPPGHAPDFGVIRAVAWHGDLALVGFPDRTVGVWQGSGEPVAYLRGETRLVGTPFVRDTLVSSVAMAGRFVFAGCVDLTAVIWNLDTREVVFAATDHAEAIVALLDGGWVTSGGAVWRGGAKVLATDSHFAEVCANGDAFVARTYADAIEAWNLDGTRVQHVAPRERGSNWSDQAVTLIVRPGLLVYPDGIQRLVVRHGDRTATIARDANIITVRASAELLGVEGWRDVLELWSFDGALLRELAAPGGVGDFAFSPDGTRVAVGAIGNGGGRYPRPVIVYDAATGAARSTIAAHDWQVRHVAFSPDGRTLASLADELVLWDLDADREVARIAVASRTSGDFAYLADGRLLVVDDGRARVYRGGELVREFAAPIGFRTLWCVEGNALAIAMRQAVARFDLDGGTEVVAAAIPRPEQLVPPELAQLEPRSGAAVWRTLHGTFLHQSDGPRGWVQPLVLEDGLVAVPVRDGAALLRDGALAGSVPFTGKLRASRIAGGEVLLVNHEGLLFRAPVTAG